MKYATGHALNTNELFLNFPNKKLNMTAQECENLIGNRHKEYIAKLVFKACVGLVIDDIINDNVTFELPTKSKKAELGMKTYERDEFIKCRLNGKFLDIDFLNSNFTAHLMNFKFLTGGVMREKLIYLDPKHKEEIINNINQGKSYY